MSVPEAQALLDRLTRIRARAGAYFGQIRLALDQVEPPDRWSRSTSDFFSEKLSPDQRAEAASIVVDLHEFAATIPPVTRQSALLGEADERDIGHAIKSMRATVRFRRYSFWDTEVLWDEDRVLGVRRPGQDEDTPLDPKDAETTFTEAADRLESVISLATGSATRDLGQPPLPSRPVAGHRPGTAFIMMWMERTRTELEDVSDTVKRCFKAYGVAAFRADDIEHEDVITKRILDEIKGAEFLFADLTGERPSVYYEVGYAHAVGRRVILFRRRGTQIHFDLAAYNCPEYESLRDLEQQLNRRLESVTGVRLNAEVQAPRRDV